MTAFHLGGDAQQSLDRQVGGETYSTIANQAYHPKKYSQHQRQGSEEDNHERRKQKVFQEASKREIKKLIIKEWQKRNTVNRYPREEGFELTIRVEFGCYMLVNLLMLL